MKIVILDNEELMNRSISNYFRFAKNFEVISILNSDESKNMSDRHINGLRGVLIDRQLLNERAISKGHCDVRDGDGLLKAIQFRKDSRYSNVPIILYSRLFKNDVTLVAALRAEHEKNGIFIVVGNEAEDLFNTLERAWLQGPW